MSLSLGALALISAISAAGGLANAGVQYAANKSLQKDSQDFNARESQLARDFAAEEAATARGFNAEQAQLSRDFEATKYQRTVADMKAAGINPAFISGAGVSSSSPMASTGNAVSSPYASSNALGISSPGFDSAGSILSSAFDKALVESFKNERFVKSMTERTAYQAQRMAFEREKYENYLKKSNEGKRGSKDPDWLKKYVEDFEKDVQML